MRLPSRENFNIVVNGVVSDSGGKDQSKTQTHSVDGPYDFMPNQKYSHVFFVLPDWNHNLELKNAQLKKSHSIQLVRP